MAITRSNKGSIATSEIKAGQEPDKKAPNAEPASLTDNPNFEAPKGFFKSTIAELKKAQWPSFGYVIRWSMIIILFTGIMSSLLGFFDFTLENMLEFVDCTSPQGRSQEVSTCSEELFENMTYQNLNN
jgi:preprotein translocase SecE subunit